MPKAGFRARSTSPRGLACALATTRAPAHKLLVAAYNVLLNDVDYKDLGESYLDRVARKKVTKALVGRLQALGFRVTLEAVNATKEGQPLQAGAVIREAREVQTQLAVLETDAAPT